MNIVWKNDPADRFLRLIGTEETGGRTGGIIVYAEIPLGTRGDVRTIFQRFVDLGEGSKEYTFSLIIPGSENNRVERFGWEIYETCRPQPLSIELLREGRQKAIELAGTLPDDIKAYGARCTGKELQEAWRRTLTAPEEVPPIESAPGRRHPETA